MADWAWDDVKSNGDEAKRKMSNDDESELKTNDFAKVQQTQCKGMDIHNILLFSWQKLLIDIRLENEYKKSHIKQFINIPLNSDEKHVLQMLKHTLTAMTPHNTINIYCYSNKNMITNKLDIKWYEYIQQILCKCFSKKYKFGTFNILNIDYATFENKYEYLINLDNCKASDRVKQYPSIIIDNKLFLGDSEDAEDREIIIDYGITHIINVTFECENEFEDDKDLNIKYLQFELTDSPNTNIADKFNNCIEFMENAFNENNGNNNNCILCHCFAGVSRSSSVIIAYLMKTRNMEFTDALEFVKDKRAIICPNEGFEKQLKMWEKKGYKLL